MTPPAPLSRKDRRGPFFSVGSVSAPSGEGAILPPLPAATARFPGCAIPRGRVAPRGVNLRAAHADYEKKEPTGKPAGEKTFVKRPSDARECFESSGFRILRGTNAGNHVQHAPWEDATTVGSGSGRSSSLPQKPGESAAAAGAGNDLQLS